MTGTSFQQTCFSSAVFGKLFWFHSITYAMHYQLALFQSSHHSFKNDSVVIIGWKISSTNSLFFRPFWKRLLVCQSIMCSLSLIVLDQPTCCTLPAGSISITSHFQFWSCLYHRLKYLFCKLAFLQPVWEALLVFRSITSLPCPFPIALLAQVMCYELVSGSILTQTG